jgi:hypothetical protein
MTRVRNMGMARHIPMIALHTAGDIVVTVSIVKWVEWMDSEEKVKRTKQTSCLVLICTIKN